jgi:hypothetical protein
MKSKTHKKNHIQKLLKKHMKSLTSKNYHKNSKKEKKTRINKKEKKNISRKKSKKCDDFARCFGCNPRNKECKRCKENKKIIINEYCK